MLYALYRLGRGRAEAPRHLRIFRTIEETHIYIQPPPGVTKCRTYRLCFAHVAFVRPDAMPQLVECRHHLDIKIEPGATTQFHSIWPLRLFAAFARLSDIHISNHTGCWQAPSLEFQATERATGSNSKASRFKICLPARCRTHLDLLRLMRHWSLAFAGARQRRRPSCQVAGRQVEKDERTQ